MDSFFDSLFNRQFLSIPLAFWFRRLHSFLGFGLIIYIIFHLWTNSRAVFWMGNDGLEFIRDVNLIHTIPFLNIVEILILGIPIAIHAAFGIFYLYTAKSNSFFNDGRHPSLPEYGRNQAYTWQRITSWILFVGIIVHVVQMRFVDAPQSANGVYTVNVREDSGLHSLASRLGVSVEANEALGAGWMVASAPDFGTAELLMVRETFKSPLMMLFYTIFVLAACFHAFNGLWTFLISWGLAISVQSQKTMLVVSTVFMLIVTFLGLSTVYLTYYVNLRQ